MNIKTNVRAGFFRDPPPVGRCGGIVQQFGKGPGAKAA